MIGFLNLQRFLIVPKMLLLFSFPLLLFLSHLYLFISPLWVQFEYNKPDLLPHYIYSYSRRLELAKATLDYIRSDKDIDFLYDLRAAEFPIYSKREIAHLVEIKSLIQKLLDIHLTVLITSFFSLSILCLDRKTRLKILPSIVRGSLFLAAIIGILLITIFLDWNNLFLLFHNIFFTQGNYSFSSSFTIIQLFPPRFWFDTALTWLLFILIEILTIVNLMRWINKRRAKKQKHSQRLKK